MSRALVVAAIVLLGVVAFAGTAFAVDVTLTDEGFDPDPVEVGIGEEVTFINATDTEHSVVAADNRWESGPLAPGESFSISFDEAGEVAYLTGDGAFGGTVVVAAAAGPTEAPTAEPPATAEPTATPATEVATPIADPSPPAIADTGIAALPLVAGAALFAAVGAGLLRRR